MEDDIRIFNTMGRKLQAFSPRDDDNVKVFTCGPSIYARPHIGNYRTFLFQDVLIRYLRYSGFEVIRAMNLTDVEDKAIYMAESEGISVMELTERNESRLWDEWDDLRMERPDKVPRSSMSIELSVKLIKLLIANGIAYVDNGDVFYSPKRFEGFGRLFGLDMSRWPKRPRKFRKDTYPGIQWNRGDFILWHSCSEEEKVCWDRELGSGRPSWNVQDPAMCWESLGTEIDIWMGGWDNLWRHHDYNIAVMEGAHGVELAPYWLHGGHLFIDGKKMSKSKGNVLYIEDLVHKGYSPSEIRFYLLYGPWRKKRNLTDKHLRATIGRLRRMKVILNELEAVSGDRTDGRAKRIINGMEKVFTRHMSDNLDLPSAFNGILERLERLNRHTRTNRITREDAEMTLKVLKDIDQVFSFIFN